MVLKVHHDKRREENQLDATECFIALIIYSTCFGHLYAYHQELETKLVVLSHMVCNALVAGGRLLGAEQHAMRPGWGKLCDTVTQFASCVKWVPGLFIVNKVDGTGRWPPTPSSAEVKESLEPYLYTPSLGLHDLL